MRWLRMEEEGEEWRRRRGRTNNNDQVTKEKIIVKLDQQSNSRLYNAG